MATPKGTLHVKIQNDRNPGKLHLVVGSPFAGQQDLADVQLAPDELFEKTFTRLRSNWYNIRLDWSPENFHNIAMDGRNEINDIPGWQVAGNGTFGSIPVFVS